MTKQKFARKRLIILAIITFAASLALASLLCFLLALVLNALFPAQGHTIFITAAVAALVCSLLFTAFIVRVYKFYTNSKWADLIAAILQVLFSW